MSWYHEWFNETEYLQLYQHRDEEEAKLIINLIEKQLPLKPKSKILDLCCGNGRHSIQLSKRGYSVTGIDLSENLLTIARENARKHNTKIRFIQADMRNINFNKEFDLTLNLFTSFGYFPSDTENEKVISNISNALKSNGFLVIDFLNKEYLLNNLKQETVSYINNSIVIQKRKICGNKIIKEITIQKKQDKKIFSEEVIMYTLSDFESFFKRNNLKFVNIYGDYLGSKFDKYSQRLIIFGQKQ